MSYMRYNHPLRWFKGKSASYVFTSDENKIEDYNDRYDNLCSFADLIGRFVYQETRDVEYADKIVRTLAKKLNIYHNLRVDIPLTSDQIRGIEPVNDTELYIPEKTILNALSEKFNVKVEMSEYEDVAEYMRFYPDVIGKMTELLEIIRVKFPESLTMVRLMPHDRDCVIFDIVMPSYGDTEVFLKQVDDCYEPRFSPTMDGGHVFVTTNWRRMETIT